MNINCDIPDPSFEQQFIIEKFKEGKNLIVNSVVGSGKSTLLLHLVNIASKEKKRSLIVTYNKALQVDLNERVIKNGMSKFVEVKTIHSSCGRSYSSAKNGIVIVKDDKTMMLLKDTPLPNDSLLRGFNVVMIDEAQDLNPEKTSFLQKIIKDKQIVLVGDERQMIYGYSNCTSEYFINAHLYFPNEREWCKTNMITSFRLTPLMANFVDRHIMGPNINKKTRLIGGNKKSKDKKVKVYSFNHPNLTQISNRIFKLIDLYGVEEVAIVVPSISKKGDSRPNPTSPLGKIISILSEKGIIPSFMSGETPKSSDGSFESGRLLISTWCSMKGREKDAIIVLGADEGYFRFYCRDWQDNNNIPNSIYVAMTRAKKEMIVLVDVNSGPLRTFDLNIINETAEVKGILKKKLIDAMDRYTEINELCVTDTLKHRRVRDIFNLLSLIEEVDEKEYESVSIGKRYIIPFISISPNGKREMLSHVGSYYGTVITELVEYELTNKCKSRLYRIFDFILSFIRKTLEKTKSKSISNDYTCILKATNPSIIKAFGVEMVSLKKKLLSLDFEKEYEESQDFLINTMLPTLLNYVDKKDKRREEIIIRIIESMKKEISAKTLMEIACQTDSYKYLYLSTIFSNMEWVDVDFITECCDNLKIYIKSVSDEIGTFEVPVKCKINHPHLKHLGKVRKAINNQVRVRVKTEDFDTEDTEYFNKTELEIINSEIVTSDPFKLSNQTIKLSGRIDYIDSNGIYHEFKIASDDKENFSLQLGSYLSINKKEMGHVYNVNTGKRHTYKMIDGDRFLNHIARGVMNWENLKYYEENGRAPDIKCKK